MLGEYYFVVFGLNSLSHKHYYLQICKVKEVVTLIKHSYCPNENMKLSAYTLHDCQHVSV